MLARDGSLRLVCWRPSCSRHSLVCFAIVCGVLVLFGMWTRIAVVPLLIIMATAIATTKLPILQQSGFWKMAHDGRTDFAMTLGSLFLLIVGAGKLSWDARHSRECHS
jgi:putative oxidoreductase